ncbi:4'-phosphopantetheinyl transferase family protein [Streptomyces cylindrosporus]|uniref:4'-phosphopantetheinyl transferase superfamily protein n=1 Tax=Streptomyces cylindrosporus TaxID=2927583 RepID=A0ABS9YQ37_9ACTN|nr:4'-phosphopantetheinyl transferase superfamily protein [Streptomyces cylindrosporus]MCI3278969.1 4'-phosphopantetheinyl transferase superfamily protein [Streptomyces cylindrosporus]
MTAPVAPPAPDGTALPSPVFTVSSDRLDLWLIRSPAGGDVSALDLSGLDDTERSKAEAFLRPADGLLYASAHIALRRLLGRYTGRRPEQVRFGREPCPGCGEPHGRPALADPPYPLHFSLSHSSGVALVGVAAVPLGVDVEKLPGQERVEVCAQALHPDERAELAAARTADRPGRFGRLWTRKEAYLKGLGTGLSRSLAADYLGLRAELHPAGWTVLDLPCFPTHAAAAAVHSTAPAEARVRRVPERWLDASDAWLTQDAPPAVRVDLGAAAPATSAAALPARLTSDGEDAL